jgi:D-3-phosphoglycerate dehydrogenase
MAKVYLADSRPIRGEALKVLQKAGEIVKAEDTGEEDFIRDLNEIKPEIMIVGARKVTKKVLSSAPENLRGVIIYGVSYDFVDVEAATEKGVMVANTPGVNAISVAEFALGLILSLIKKIPQSHAAVRSGGWSNMTTFRFSFTGIELYNKTVGIIGLGTIGSNLAKRLNAMGVKVIAYTKHPSLERAEENNVEFMDLNTLMSKSDIVAICCALTDETKGMVGKKQIDLMNPNSYLINTSRGAVVDEQALLDALIAKRIAGAALDVIDKEPNTDSPLFELHNVICTPHIAGRTVEAGQRLELTVAEEALRIAEGKIPRNLVNKQALQYKNR